MKTIEEYYKIESYNEKTGYDCCKYLVDFCMDNHCDFPQYAIQSDNGPGSDNIDKYIKNFRKICG